MMTTSEITELFEHIAHLKVGVIGDLALDLYYTLQTHTSERSLETGQDVFWGSAPRASLGAAGNVVQNLVALGVKNVHVIGCVGNDLFGREMRYLFGSLRVNTDLLHTPATGWDTCVYTKPMVGDAEANRIDFGTQNLLIDVLFAELLLNLEQVLPELDVLIINQQFANPLLNEDRVASMNNLISRFPQIRFVADMRQFGKQIRGAVLKVNTAELALFRQAALPSQPDITWCIEQAQLLGQQTNGPIVVTRSEAGILYVD